MNGCWRGEEAGDGGRLQVVMRGQGLGVGGRRGPGEPAGPAEALNGRDVASLGQQLDADCSLAFPFGPEIRFTVGAL